MVKMAIVLTCFNRVYLTVQALETLLNLRYIAEENIKIKIFLCDDGSTDDTGNEVMKRFKNVTIVEGNGQLFWAKGMAEAALAAENFSPDYYLMINDDVNFYSNAIQIMFESYKRHVHEGYVAITGATKSKNGQYTYGGLKRIEKSKSLHCVTYALPGEKCDLSNWNCFLLPSELYNKIGRIDDYYEHSYADFDYARRICGFGGSVYVSDEYIGVCERNLKENTWEDKSLNPFERLRKLHKPNGLPIKSQIHYYWKFEGIAGLYWVIKPYLVIIKDSILYRGSKRRKEQ